MLDIDIYSIEYVLHNMANALETVREFANTYQPERITGESFKGVDTETLRQVLCLNQYSRQLMVLFEINPVTLNSPIERKPII